MSLGNKPEPAGVTWVGVGSPLGGLERGAWYRRTFNERPEPRKEARFSELRSHEAIWTRSWQGRSGRDISILLHPVIGQHWAWRMWGRSSPSQCKPRQSTRG